MPDTELLTNQQIAEIADMFPHAEYQPTLSPDEVDSCKFCKGTIDDHKANCVVPHVHALIATVKQLGRDNEALETQCKGLRGQSAELRNRISERNDRIVDLQSQLEQLRAENEQLKLIVDVGTNDDPGTALAKLRKIQHVAATSMRDKCVENLGSLVEGYKNDLFATDDEDYKASLGFAVDALDKAIRSISSLTLEPLEPEKQKL